MKIKQAYFYRCLGLKEDIHQFQLPFNIQLQGLIVGRSNVGKSSLINHLSQNQHLAKVSSTPGKTQTINVYIINEQFALMDLPGYGFAKRSKQNKNQWNTLINAYLEVHRPHFILILIDIRHPLTEDDKTMIEWSKHMHLNCILIFTKSDKISKTKLKQQEEAMLKQIREKTNLSSFSHVCYSIKESKSRQTLLQLIAQML